jgi:hypothetical protein
VRLLKDADLQVPLGQLQYMRNEIYARHGYAFQNKKWATHFHNMIGICLVIPMWIHV